MLCFVFCVCRHSTTYRAETTLNYGMERVWALAASPDNNKVNVRCSSSSSSGSSGGSSTSTSTTNTSSTCTSTIVVVVAAAAVAIAVVALVVARVAVYNLRSWLQQF